MHSLQLSALTLCLLRLSFATAAHCDSISSHVRNPLHITFHFHQLLLFKMGVMISDRVNLQSGLLTVSRKIIELNILANANTFTQTLDERDLVTHRTKTKS